MTQAAHLQDPFRDGQNYLELTVNGKRALISSEQIKLSLLKRGYVFLGPEWEARLPVIEVPPDPAARLNGLTLHGFTNDPEIARLVRDWLVFETGPLPEVP